MGENTNKHQEAAQLWRADIPPQRRALEFYYILPYMSSLFLNLINILQLEGVDKI